MFIYSICIRVCTLLLFDNYWKQYKYKSFSIYIVYTVQYRALVRLSVGGGARRAIEKISFKLLEPTFGSG